MNGGVTLNPRARMPGMVISGPPLRDERIDVQENGSHGSGAHNGGHDGGCADVFCEFVGGLFDQHDRAGDGAGDGRAAGSGGGQYFVDGADHHGPDDGLRADDGSCHHGTFEPAVVIGGSYHGGH